MKSCRLLMGVGLVLAGLVSGGLVTRAGERTDDPLGVAVSPQTLLLGAVQSGRVTVHTDIPLSTVATDSLALNGLPAIGAFADALGHLVAVFDESAVKALAAPPALVLTLTGAYRTGERFAGSDTVRVTAYVGE